jgi:hypothetical protein
VRTPGREDAAAPVLTLVSAFVLATVAFQLRLFNTVPISTLSVSFTLAIFATLARYTEPRGSPWTIRGTAAFSLVLGQLFLALLFWPTTPAVGGAMVALACAGGLLVVGTDEAMRARLRGSIAALGTLLVLLLLTARWN